ncbi:efflux transporter outer membrane subunit [Ferrovum sp. PN-J185]|uniref:efflux transporter outer membrane subunit n=1 Tax=Ferrovum sp. PN-J185 TaxID=1356306 RepID=UPI0007993D66|nr:efflux transporter outer membrane subunit [Ferrovum sp. PN-J185]KXW56750.1 outer membrane protein OprM precursor [Ferrovum sp. PN-J185]MCC6068212.1 efflux transporter outer membrane subunit [Ferrovum sp. PN-J185]MDE1891318.1 efflux transporter outer membrane subunit [Betaproteobacteria bacterium]MDE2056156.1 efflux transporter outer membrane subunit [Betaproteobacteria bacterium]
MIKKTTASTSLLILFIFMLTGCAVGPDYVKPTSSNPASFTVPKGWKVAQPNDNNIPSNWWQLFHDPVLNDLETQVEQSNQSLAQQFAALRQARALVTADTAPLFPSFTLNETTTRNRYSSGAFSFFPGHIFDNHSLNMQASWELDVWGSIRRQIEADVASMQASASQVAATRLSLQSQLAADYFQLRADDTQEALLQQTIQVYKQYIELTKNRFDEGVAAETDLIQAETQLKTAETQMIDLGVQRSQMEHAIAVLIGKAPSELQIKKQNLTDFNLEIPVTVPSVLIERRPDVSVAERNAASASAKIGVAKAAFFPTVNLTGNIGYQSNIYNNLIGPSNYGWGISPSVSLPIFDGGQRLGGYREAVAQYDQAVANYRQVVLTAFQNVEDNLSAAAILTREISVQNEAVELSKKNLDLTRSQYIAGTVNYLNVITAQATLLSSQINAIQIKSRQYVAGVQLVVALGGGWDKSQEPELSNK